MDAKLKATTWPWVTHAFVLSVAFLVTHTSSPQRTPAVAARRHRRRVAINAGPSFSHTLSPLVALLLAGNSSPATQAAGMDGHGSKLRAAAAPPAPRAVPDDALVEMFELLPSKSLHRFKCVSKSWCAMVTDPLHRQRFAQTLAGFLCADVAANDDTAAETASGGGSLCRGCREGDDDGRAESSRRRRRTTRRFINISRMAAPLIDATFPFLPQPPAPPSDGEGFFRDVILDARDGLILLARLHDHNDYSSPDQADLHPPASYLVCNPSTSRWTTVPSSGWTPSSSEQTTRTFLLFDAATSPHVFHLLQFRVDDMDTVRSIHTYSSSNNTWTNRALQWHAGGWRDWGRAMALIQPGTGAAVAGGMLLHLVVDTDGTTGPNNLVAVDEQGNTRRTIPLPRRDVAEKDWHSVFVGKSQGRIHFVMCVRPPHGWLSEEHPLRMMVWVLDDDDGDGEWVLKHTVSFTELFGRIACQFRVEYSVVLFILMVIGFSLSGIGIGSWWRMIWGVGR